MMQGTTELSVVQFCETAWYRILQIVHDRNGKLSLDRCLEEQVLPSQLTVQLEEVKN
ncbi:hypothetical protein Nmel_010261 [Mimus melanotis]